MATLRERTENLIAAYGFGFSSPTPSVSMMDICESIDKEIAEALSFAQAPDVSPCVTPNHVILTTRGWIQAKDLTKEEAFQLAKRLGDGTFPSPT
jgi:hypothetical protein